MQGKWRLRPRFSFSHCDSHCVTCEAETHVPRRLLPKDGVQLFLFFLFFFFLRLEANNTWFDVVTAETQVAMRHRWRPVWSITRLNTGGDIMRIVQGVCYTFLSPRSRSLFLFYFIFIVPSQAPVDPMVGPLLNNRQDTRGQTTSWRCTGCNSCTMPLRHSSTDSMWRLSTRTRPVESLTLGREAVFVSGSYSPSIVSQDDEHTYLHTITGAVSIADDFPDATVRQPVRV